MNVFIVITGSEFVDGIKPERNSLFIARESLERGLEVVGIIIVGDDIYRIEQAVRYALDKADIVFVSGGMGPTSDDITREAIQEAIGVQFIFDKEWLEKLKKEARENNKEITENLKKLAKIPYGSAKIENPVGKALGFIKILEDKAIIGLPGVPSELKAMLPLAFEKLGLKEKKKRLHLFRTFGLSEVEIDKILSDIDQVHLNPSPKGVDIFVKDKEPEFLQNKIDVIRERLGNVIYAEGDVEMEEVVGKLLKEHGKTVSTAESSTGGLIVSRLVNVPGSSAYVIGGITAYANEAKINILGVKKESLEKYGAVSEVVAREMVEGVRRLTNADISVSDTGIAGPTGATKEKPLGLHYVGFTDGKHTEVHKVVFKGERNDVRLRISQYALNLIRLYFLKK